MRPASLSAIFACPITGPVSAFAIPVVSCAEISADMQRYLAFNMGQAPTPLNSLLPVLQRRWHEGGRPRADVGLAWQMMPLRGTGHRMIWKNGAASGFFSFIGFVKETNIGVVVIVNRKAKVGLVAMRVLRILNGAPAATAEPEEEPPLEPLPEAHWQGVEKSLEFQAGIDFALNALRESRLPS